MLVRNFNRVLKIKNQFILKLGEDIFYNYLYFIEFSLTNIYLCILGGMLYAAAVGHYRQACSLVGQDILLLRPTGRYHATPRGVFGVQTRTNHPG